MLIQLAMLDKSSSQERREILPRHHGPHGPSSGDSHSDFSATYANGNGVRSTPKAVQRLLCFFLAIAVFIALIFSYSSTTNHPFYKPQSLTHDGTDVNYTNIDTYNPLKNYGFYTVLRPATHPDSNSNIMHAAAHLKGEVVPSHDGLTPLQTRTMAMALFGGGTAIQKLGFGAAAGMTVGIATKRIFKVAIIFVGVIFVAIQVMAIRGWLHVDWNAISREISPQLTAYHHGKVVSVLSHNVPFASAFSAGCLFAFVWL